MKLLFATRWQSERVDGQLETMVLALAVWLCGLPLVGLFVLPFFGLKVAGLVALGLLFVALIACWLICAWPKSTGPKSPAGVLDLELSRHQDREVHISGESAFE